MGEALGRTIGDFWAWSSSDLLSNATRGIFAEFIVAAALGLAIEDVRTEWAEYDLEVPDPRRISIEVKSSAYIQSWDQLRDSKISFDIRKTQQFSAETNSYCGECARRAMVYVFALLAHRDRASIDPLNMDQWRFYVVPTTELDKLGDQKRISLAKIQKLTHEVRFSELRDSVLQAVPI